MTLANKESIVKLNTILTIVTCPQCLSDLKLIPNGKVYCGACDKSYPLTEIDYKLDLRLDNKLASLPKESRLRNLIKPPSPTLNHGGRQRIQHFITEFDKNQVILNFGSGTQPHFAGNVYNVDIFPYSNVDIICPVDVIPFKRNSVDAIICVAVLEHVKNPQEIIQKFQEMLKNSGRIYVEIPFMQGVHADPYDFQRFTPDGLRALLSDFREEALDSLAGPASSLCWILREFVASFGGNSNIFYNMLKLLSGWATFPIKYLDIILKPTIGGQKIASGYYFIGEKPS